MTEAELQRLAEIMTQLAPAFSDPSFSVLPIIVAFVAGASVTVFAEWVRWLVGRRAILRVSRADLYLELSNYRMWLSYAQSFEQGDLDADNGKLSVKRLGESWSRLRKILISTDDRKYTKKIAQVLLGRDSRDYDGMFKTIDQTIEALEKEQPLFRRIEADHFDWLKKLAEENR